MLARMCSTVRLPGHRALGADCRVESSLSPRTGSVRQPTSSITGSRPTVRRGRISPAVSSGRSRGAPSGSAQRRTAAAAGPRGEVKVAASQGGAVPAASGGGEGSDSDSRGDKGGDSAAKRTLNVQFAAIALPALAQFAAEPLAGLVDTAYLGRLGAEALGGAGVAISTHYATAKIFNDPLLRTSISIVACGDGESIGSEAAPRSPSQDKSGSRSDAIGAALVLALAIGLVQMVFFLALAPALVSGMGAGPESPMNPVAVAYLRVKALGTPTATLWLVCNGIFRGLGDTRTPLVWALLFAALNAALDPLFIFTLRCGAAGAAAGTALSQTAALAGLLVVLRRRTGVDISPRALLTRQRLAELGPALLDYGRAGVLVFARSWGKMGAYTYVSRLATGLGPVAAAAHLLCFNLGVLLSQLCECVAVATQTLLARALGTLRVAGAASPAGAGARRDAWHVIWIGSLVGTIIAGGLTAISAFRPEAVIAGLTTDPAVRTACGAIMFPVLCSQLFKGLAYPANGVAMGGLDWTFATLQIWLGSGLCLALAHTQSPPTLMSIWVGIAAFNALQPLLVIVRVATRTGPWAALFRKQNGGTGAKLQ